MYSEPRSRRSESAAAGIRCRRRGVVLSLFSAIALLLTACGSESGGGTASPEPTATATVEVEEFTATPGETGAAEDGEAIHVFGTLTINDKPAPDGATVEVRADGELCAEGEVKELGGEATYALDIPRDCGDDGDWELYVEGVPVGELEREDGRQDLALAFGEETATPPPSPTRPRTPSVRTRTATPEPTRTVTPTRTPSPTRTPTATRTPEPTPLDPSDYFDLLAGIIQKHSFMPVGEPVAVENQDGSFLIAQKGVCEGTATGACQSVFFLVNDSFVGQDAEVPWLGISDPVLSGDGGILLNYANWAPDDPMCCPSLPDTPITFYWDGSSLISSGIPPSELEENLPGEGGITGGLGYPSDAVPALAVVAFETTTGDTYWILTERTQQFFTMTGLPPGTYQLVAYVDGYAGGYTQAVPCGLSLECTDHSLIGVPVNPGETTGGVDIADWYAPEGAFPPKPEGVPAP